MSLAWTSTQSFKVKHITYFFIKKHFIKKKEIGEQCCGFYIYIKKNINIIFFIKTLQDVSGMDLDAVIQGKTYNMYMYMYSKRDI